jgi:hypothetical protein
MNMRIIPLILMFILISAANIHAETTIKAEVDKASISLGEAIAYKVMITSSLEKIPQPKFPDFKEFTVLSQAQTSEITVAKGKHEAFVAYVFIIAPNRTGRMKIEPAQIKIEKKVFSSESIEIEVREGKMSDKPEPSEKQVEPEEAPEEQEQPKITL